MVDFTNFEEVKKAYPIDSYVCIDRLMQITGYYFDTHCWWPANLVEGIMMKENELVEIPAPQVRNKY